LESGDLLPIVTAENVSTRPYSLTALLIRRYEDPSGETHEFPLPPPGELDDDLARYLGESGPTGLLAAIELAAQPNYLGSPDVVSALVKRIFEIEVDKRTGRATYAQGLAVNQKVTNAFTGDDSRFARMPGWHAAAWPDDGSMWLGKAVIKYFNLDPGYYHGESMSCILSEGFAGLGLHIQEMLKAFEADDATQWNPDALMQLNEVQQFVVSVLLGTNVLLHGDRTLKDFGWRRVGG
jgi:hypothetical protein